MQHKHGSDGEKEKPIYDEIPEPAVIAKSRPAHIWILFGVITSIIIIIIFFYGTETLATYDWQSLIGPEFLLFVLGGFIAQMIDGSLGMAYGVSASTFLLSFGISPAASSASVHTAEIFTSGVFRSYTP